MRPLIVGNWKMNLDAQAATDLAVSLKSTDSVEVVVCPAFVHLSLVRHALVGAGIHLGAQDCHAEVSGAYTGDVSAPMLKDLGCAYVILGHSERRQGHGETSATVAQKALAVQKAGMTPIICIGETEHENEQGRTQDVLKQQLSESVPKGLDNYVIAYEPVWAIGTGKVATLAQIKETHAFIRSCVKAEAPILYGGSVKPDSAAQILKTAEVGGVLVGGASLRADDFNAIIRAYS